MHKASNRDISCHLKHCHVNLNLILYNISIQKVCLSLLSSRVISLIFYTVFSNLNSLRRKIFFVLRHMITSYNCDKVYIFYTFIFILNIWCAFMNFYTNLVSLIYQITILLHTFSCNCAICTHVLFTFLSGQASFFKTLNLLF